MIFRRLLQPEQKRHSSLLFRTLRLLHQARDFRSPVFGTPHLPLPTPTHTRAGHSPLPWAAHTPQNPKQALLSTRRTINTHNRFPKESRAQRMQNIIFIRGSSSLMFAGHLLFEVSIPAVTNKKCPLENATEVKMSGSFF